MFLYHFYIIVQYSYAIVIILETRKSEFAPISFAIQICGHFLSSYLHPKQLSILYNNKQLLISATHVKTSYLHIAMGSSEKEIEVIYLFFTVKNSFLYFIFEC